MKNCLIQKLYDFKGDKIWRWFRNFEDHLYFSHRKSKDN